MEEIKTADSSGVRDVLMEVGSDDLSAEALSKLATVAAATEKSIEELRAVLAEWDAFAKSVEKGAGVLQGFCHLILGDAETAEEILKANKRSEWGCYYLARAHLTRNRTEEALKVAEEAYEKFPNMVELAYLSVELLIRHSKTEEAAKILSKLKKKGEGTCDFLYHSGLLLEKTGDYPEAIQHFRNAVAKNPHHAESYFRLGYLLDLYGTEADDANEDAVGAYEACVKITPVCTNAVINLGLLYEDRERYHDAIKCYETVVRRFPEHERARLYLGDAIACTRMFYDKDQEKKADRQSQVLKIPVSDFELSVRSRNCLQKMNIDTLGDLIMKTEQELLSYKNFGETSLAEIKEMLGQKGLRLGQGLDSKTGDTPSGRNPLEATASPEVLSKPIEELDLSVRSRRCMERLDVRTVRDLINKTEVELMSAKNFGMTSLNEIKRKLADLGLSLRS